MTREKTKWEKVVDAENAKDEVKSNTVSVLSVEVLIEDYESEWNKIPWYVKILGSKKMLGKVCYLAGSVEGMKKLIEASAKKEKEKNEKRPNEYI